MKEWITSSIEEDTTPIDPLLKNIQNLNDAKNVVMQMEGVIEGLKIDKGSQIKVEEINLTIPSPFAFNLVAQGALDIMKIEDRVDFIRRMHQNVIAKINR